MLDREQQMLIVNSFCAAAEVLRDGAAQYSAAMEELRRPSNVYRPRLYIDGNQWCALYGDNLQDGVAGFGDSPDAATRDFDKSWCSKLNQVGR